MPESIPDFPSHMANLEGKLSTLQGDILGVADKGLAAIPNLDEDFSFRAQFSLALTSWTEFQSVWDNLRATHLAAGEDFPNRTWQGIYSAVRQEVRDAQAILLRLEAQRTQRSADALERPSAGGSSFYSSARSHLPKISIPQFSGDLAHWSHFKDTFMSMVHNEPSLSQVEKFHYLKGALKGEASSLVARFTVDAASYKQAWDKLNSVYDNPRVLASLFINRIVDCQISIVKSEEQKYERFLSNVADSLESFRALKLENPSECLLATLALRALDPETRKQFELSLPSSDTFPTADNVIEFVRQRKIALRMTHTLPSSGSSLSNKQPISSPRYPSRQSSKYNASVALHTTGEAFRHNSDSEGSKTRSALACLHCKKDHVLSKCDSFIELSVPKRSELVRSWKVCFNCLQKGHSVRDCRSKYNCRTCHKRHHTLIHEASQVKTNNASHPDKSQAQDPPQPKPQDVAGTAGTFIGFGSSTSAPPVQCGMVLLGTIRALVKGHRGDYHSARAVLDSGSQHSFITSSLAAKLGGSIAPFVGSITSLAESAVPQSYLKGSTSCVIRPYEGNKQFNIQPIVVDRITSALPSRNLPEDVVQSLMHHPLADHGFGVSRPIDLLIGGDLFPRIITGVPIESGIEELILLPTSFGLVVSGTVKEVDSNSTHAFFTESHHGIESQIKAFWDVEEPVPVNRSHPDDVYCEEHFARTHSRTPDGRYVVRLPFKKTHSPTGSNRDVATRRFLSLEQKFLKNPGFAQCYSTFIDEYLSLGHMSPASAPSSYLIPHHGIWQSCPNGQKLRVVFDASCPSSHCSLNDQLLPGPKLQEDICSIFIRFRLYLVPLCTDLVKMYRQIQMHLDDRLHQHILWRSHPSDELVEFELNTVTYGINSSAFLALRVIKQLIIDEGSNYPLAASRLSTDIYVDDVVTGADSVEEAVELQHQLIQLFAKGGFSLSKWSSSINQLIPSQQESVESISVLPPGEHHVKILGLIWNPSSDAFSYSVVTPDFDRVTKRAMLSSIARIFDPLGLLAPIIFTAKTLIQEVWKVGIGWDEVLPDSLDICWRQLMGEWDILSTISIPRYIALPQPSFQLVGFSDASSKGYAAALYLRIEDPVGNVKVSLIKAKTKVAPLKFMTIPRLELCGALLLARLTSSIPQQLSQGTICFTDSTVVLAWLNTPVHALNVFEANRVSQILSVVPSHLWRHVRSEDNPADLASRGCTPRMLKEEVIWWSGPLWLSSPVSEWFTPTSGSVVMTAISPSTAIKTVDPYWIARFSSLHLLIRTIARILRLARKTLSSSAGAITADEFSEAEIRCVVNVQRNHFPKDLFSDPPVFPKCLMPLSPFLDERGVLRVGGRLQSAPLSYSAKHPILLPCKSHFARLVVEDIHQRHFHAGPSLTLSLLRGKYWITRATKLIRSCTRSCVKCRELNAKPSPPIMAPLPKERFDQSRAFAQVGVDYAGPFHIRESSRRNARLNKAYLCLFVCLSSKALHLELVSSLQTSTFLDSLDRFIARRGAPSVIWSDHGTNFVGASRFLKDVYIFQQKCEPVIIHHLAPRGIDWKFIPPRAPHFGGLWEAGVKSVKSLLAQSIGKQHYTFEKLTTDLAKVEALLNSRPLCALTEDAGNFEFLTPGHFLIGAPLMSLPVPASSQSSSDPYATKWQRTRAQLTHVWERWRREYLHSLQCRSKWTRRTPELKVGDLVILIEKRSILGHWPVARVTKAFPGRDGVTRSVEVCTPSGKIFTRAVTSLAPLFFSEEEVH